VSTDVSLLPDRILEQTEPWTRWDRRAWEPGAILRLRELSEATAWVQKGVLSEGATIWLRDSLRPLIGQDPGLGTGAVRSQLGDLLKNKLTHGSQAQRQLEQLISFTDDGYMRQWRNALAGGGQINIERASRHISSHVIDAGYHPEELRLLTKKLIASGAAATDLLDEYMMLLAAPERTFSGFVAMEHVPALPLMSKLDGWLDPQEVSSRLTNFEKHSPIRQVGGLRFDVSARDIRAAASEVADRMDRLSSRTRFIREASGLRYHAFFFSDDGTAYPIGEGKRQIHVLSLVKTGVLYSASLTDERANAVDDALQLASNLMSGPASVAAAGAWAALESLLVSGADNSRDVGRSVAADRAAALIAASWPRAELTRLSHRAEKSPQADARLRGLLEKAGDENAHRCEIVLEWLRAGGTLNLEVDRDQAAQARMEERIGNPRAVLGRVRSYVTGSLRRLYRQRNLVLHGGSVRPVALAAAMRTSGPLVGAALDRVTHAFELHDMSPLDAVARAECALKAVQDGSGWPLHDLAAA
jgi:hypothetical protein